MMTSMTLLAALLIVARPAAAAPVDAAPAEAGAGPAAAACVAADATVDALLRLHAVAGAGSGLHGARPMRLPGRCAEPAPAAGR